MQEKNDADVFLRIDGKTRVEEWNEHVLDTFRYHVPSAEQIERISNVRKGAIEFAKVIQANVTGGNYPYSVEDFQAVIRHIHDAMMTANKSIVNEKP